MDIKPVGVCIEATLSTIACHFAATGVQHLVRGFPCASLVKPSTTSVAELTGPLAYGCSSPAPESPNPATATPHPGTTLRPLFL